MGMGSAQQHQHTATAATATEKLLPQNVEAEMGMLGSLLIDPAALIQVIDVVRPDDFYREAHRLIYAGMLDLRAAGIAWDLITLCDELARRGHLDTIGGSAAVSALANQVPTSRNVRQYAQVVERCAVLRRLIQAAGEIAGVAYNEPDADEAIATAQALLANATLRHGGNDSMPFTDAVDAFLASIEETYRNGMRQGALSGFRLLDEHLLGLLPGELLYLCGRPGSGKSAYAAAMAVTHALTLAAREKDGEGGCVEWFSLEMNHIQQVKRVVTSAAGVNGRIIRAGFRMPDGARDTESYEQVKRAALAQRAKIGAHLRLYDKPLTMDQLGQQMARAVMRRGCKLAVVDYLGLLESDDATARASDYQRVSKISRQLKQLALQLNIPIICLVQLNRDCEKRADKRPQLPDLRDSGSLEQDGDFVIGVYRGAYYNPDLGKVDDHFNQFAELIVLKAREGVANITIPTRFEGEYTRPSDWPEDWACDLYLKMRAGDAPDALKMETASTSSEMARSKREQATRRDPYANSSREEYDYSREEDWQ